MGPTQGQQHCSDDHAEPDRYPVLVKHELPPGEDPHQVKCTGQTEHDSRDATNHVGEANRWRGGSLLPSQGLAVFSGPTGLQICALIWAATNSWIVLRVESDMSVKKMPIS